MHGSLEPDRLYVTVDILIMTVREGRLNLLLARRSSAPYAGRWALPGRFVEPDESAESCVRKLLDEMLPAENLWIEQLYTFTEVNRDPRGRVISAAYLAIVPWQRLEALLDAEETPLRPWRVLLDDRGLRLTRPDGAELTGGDLAFDHGRIIETGVNRLRGKIDYTDIGFRFLNDMKAFSLSELQTVFEAVLDTPMDSSNFRRAILGRYERSGRLEQTALAERRDRGRPAALYRFNG